MELTMKTSNTTYKNNLQNLRLRYSDLADQVEMTKVVQYKLFKNSDLAVPTFYSVINDFFYYNLNDPMRDVEGTIQQLNPNNVKIALFLGIGLGYEIIYFMKEYAAKNRTAVIIVIEKDIEIFKLALQNTDFSNAFVNENVEFIVGKQDQDLDFAIHSVIQKNQRFIFLKAFKPLYHSSSMRLYKEYYLDVIRKVKDYAVFQLNLFGNCPTDSLIGITQMLDNVKQIIENPGIADLKGKFKGKPAIIVSAGPSLNKNKDLLRGLESKALIIAVDSAFPILMNMGIKPHMVISLERTMTTLKHMSGYTDEEVENTFYTACPVVRNEVYQAYRGPKIMVFRETAQFKWLGLQKGTLRINRSAGNMSYKIASYLACDPIIVIGQDLSFSRDGRTHASGTAHGEKGERHEAFYDLRKRMVQGNDGQPIETNDIWLDFLQGFEMDVSLNEGLTINATEGGAFIRGTKVMTFAEAIESYLTVSYDPVRHIRQHLHIPTVKDKSKALKTIIKKIKLLIEDTKDIGRRCEVGLEVCALNHAKLIELKQKGKVDLDQTEINGLVHEVMEQRHYLEKNNTSFNEIFIHFVQSFYISFDINLNDIPNRYGTYEESIPEILLKFEEFYRTIGGFAKILEDQMKSYLQKLMEEEA